MHYNISGNGFSMLEIDLEPGESLIANAASLVSIEADVKYTRSRLGGLFRHFWVKLCLKRPIAILRLKNLTESTRHIMLTHPLPGELRSIHLKDETMCLDPHALIARFGGVKVSLRWAGIAALMAKRKPFDLVVKGTGVIWIGAYGGLLEKQVDGEYALDTHHLIAHDASIAVRHVPAGGIIAGWLRGEGFITRAAGRGKVILQTKSIYGLGSRLNSHS